LKEIPHVSHERHSLGNRAGDQRIALVPISPTEFHLDGMPLNRLVFTLGTGRTATALEWRRQSGTPERAERVNTPI
jgi:hypothetical protein